jgi:quinol monooxygenase YgiN
MEDSQNGEVMMGPRSLVNILTSLAIVKLGNFTHHHRVLAVIVLIECHPGRGAELIPALQANADHSRHEPACHRWEWSRHVDSPDKFAIYELYDDAAAFAAHKQSAHFAAWKAASDPLIAKKEAGQYLAPE